ncbi:MULTISPECIES: hypothetical protein [unclassified Pseudomonas]|uniref:hypothetical protein n=1 Tax=unclassified Pseudomonas TaxID=196821 RepID=UPI001179F839|nr:MULTISPECIES: hypothetical protein [unclassified Pseudomonas]
MVIGRKSHVTPSPVHTAPDSNSIRIRPGNTTSIETPAHKIARSALPPEDYRAMQKSSDTDVRITGLPLAENASIRSVVMSLENYRLRLPSRLPAADIWGIRRFKGREFVDVAPGEIVQVRLDISSGQYRATLASEQFASGPRLVLDRRTMIWGAEQLSILPEVGNVMSSRPDLDPSGPKPSIEKNVPPGPGKLYEGRDDIFERRASQTVKIVARGLKQFTPSDSASLRAELSATRLIFSDANHGIAMNYVEAAGIFQGYFGEHHALVKERLTDCLSRGEALSKEYQGPWGLDKFVGVEFDQDRRAWMYSMDFHGRFFISLNHLQAGDFAAVLGHEMLHTNRVNRFTSVGPGALDFFYLDARMGKALDRPVPVYDIAEQGVSEIIMQGGLTLAYLDGFTSDHSSFTTGVRDSLGLPGRLEVRTAVDLFNAHSAVRTWMAANNADSIIYAAKSLQALHRGRTADSQLLSSLLNN